MREIQDPLNQGKGHERPVSTMRDVDPRDMAPHEQERDAAIERAKEAADAPKRP